MDLAAMAGAARRRLEAAGFDSETASRDSALLARWVLGWTAADWLSRSRESAPRHFPVQFDSLIARRAAHEPIAYLTREREFYGRAFTVTRDVLIPRPETECVVEEALACLGRLPAARSVRLQPDLEQDPPEGGHHIETRAPLVVDVGTGSGCLAITIALEHSAARVIATDISPAALAVAAENARALGAADRIELREGAFLAGIAAPIDLIVSNPPYVAEADRPMLPREVSEFEPAAALFGGRDGLDVIRALLPLAAAALAPGGSLVMEIGSGQLEDVRRLIEDAGLTLARVREDLQGIPRVVLARLD